MIRHLYQYDPRLGEGGPIEVTVPFDEEMPPLIVSLLRNPDHPGPGAIVLRIRGPRDNLDHALLEGRARLLPEEAIPALILALKMIQEVGEAEVVRPPEAPAEGEGELYMLARVSFHLRVLQTWLVWVVQGQPRGPS